MTTIKNYKKNMVYTAGPMFIGTELHKRMSEMLEKMGEEYMDSYKEFKARVFADWPTEPRPTDEEDIS